MHTVVLFSGRLGMHNNYKGEGDAFYPQAHRASWVDGWYLAAVAPLQHTLQVQNRTTHLYFWHCLPAEGFDCMPLVRTVTMASAKLIYATFASGPSSPT